MVSKSRLFLRLGGPAPSHRGTAQQVTATGSSSMANRSPLPPGCPSQPAQSFWHSPQPLRPPKSHVVTRPVLGFCGKKCRLAFFFVPVSPIPPTMEERDPA